MAKANTYDKAYKELNEIIEGLQNDEISIDELAKQVKRANELVKFCQSKLRDTEATLKDLTNNEA